MVQMPNLNRALNDIEVNTVNLITILRRCMTTLIFRKYLFRHCFNVDVNEPISSSCVLTFLLWLQHKSWAIIMLSSVECNKKYRYLCKYVIKSSNENKPRSGSQSSWQLCKHMLLTTSKDVSPLQVAFIRFLRIIWASTMSRGSSPLPKE